MCLTILTLAFIARMPYVQGYRLERQTIATCTQKTGIFCPCDFRNGHRGHSRGRFLTKNLYKHAAGWKRNGCAFRVITVYHEHAAFARLLYKIHMPDTINLFILLSLNGFFVTLQAI